MKKSVSASVRALVVLRASHHREYCGLSQAGQEAAFHIDHVVPRAAGGGSSATNLALACVSCSLHKAAKQKSVDPESMTEVDLFNPRSQLWSNHFQWQDLRVVGRTKIGRATVAALKMNRALIIAIRREEKFRGRHPYLPT